MKKVRMLTTLGHWKGHFLEDGGVYGLTDSDAERLMLNGHAIEVLDQTSCSTENKQEGFGMDVYEEIEKELGEAQPTRPSWNPNEGDTLVGEIVRIDHIHTETVDNDLIVVKPSDGSEEITVWKSATLAEMFKQAKLGYHIGLKYLGKVKGEKGRAYKNIKYVLKPGVYGRASAGIG